MRTRPMLFAIPLAVLLVSLFSAGFALAKGDPTGATIEGPGLSRAIEVTDPELLSLLNPWAGDFANWEDDLISFPPSLDETYLIQVSAGIDGASGNPDLVYVFYYHPNSQEGSGAVYLPGRGEEGYTTNVATILAGRDGEWHPATRAFDAAIRPLISGQSATGIARWIEPITSSTAPWVALLILGAALYLGRRLLPNASKA